MARKSKLSFITISIVFGAIITIATAKGWGVSLAQTGMNMPTDTVQPQSTVSIATPQIQKTLTPVGNNIEQNSPSPTWTSIFTGFTPYPNSTTTYNSPMGGSGMMGGGMMGNYSGMSGVYTDTMGTNGMGSMGSCPMMSGSNMGSMSGVDSMQGMDMSSGNTMSGMNMSGGYSIMGMDMSGYVEQDASSVFNDPWLLIGWVLLVLLVLSILVGAVFGIAWIIRRSKQDRPT